jgi:hypothetical protein
VAIIRYSRTRANKKVLDNMALSEIHKIFLNEPRVFRLGVK